MKYLMLDIDGTLCEYYDPVAGRIHMTEFPVGFFRNKRPLQSVIKVILKDYKDYVIIIFSVSPSEQSDVEKIDWLKEHNLGNCQHIFLRYPNSDKGQALMIFMQRNNINPDDVTIIDDDHRVLRSCEKLGVHCIHPSHLVAEYENCPERYN